MHILVAFILGVSLLAGFQPLIGPPENETEFALDAGRNISVYSYMDSLQDLKNKHLVHQQYDYSCGSAALATVLNYHLGESFSERQVIQGLMEHGNLDKIRRRRAFSMLDMKRFVDVLGYHGAGYRAAVADLEALDAPAILPIRIFSFKHFVVLRGFYKNRVFLADPWLGNTSYTRKAFEDLWYDQVLFIVEPNGRPPRDLLELKAEDLRFISEDDARQAFFYPHLPHMAPPSPRELKLINPHQLIYKR